MPITHRLGALNLRHLQAWVTVVDEGSITAGARKLAVSQPALSQQLRALEDYIGGALLERLHRGVRLTPLGRAMLGDARATLAAARRVARQAAGEGAPDVGILEIATLPTLVDAVMVEPIQQWQAIYPNISIHIREFGLQSTLVESVSLGEGDLAIGVRPPRWVGPVVSLGWEQFVVVLPPSDPLAGSLHPVALRELSDRNWILYEPSNGLDDYVAAACATAGFRPREAVRTSQVQVAVHLAHAGLGAVLVPAANVPPSLSAYARSLDPPIMWELTAFTRSTLSPPAAAFVDLLGRRTWLPETQGAVILPGN